MLSNLPGFVYRSKNDPEFTPLFVSEGILEITGYHASEFLTENPRKWVEQIHPDDQPQTLEKLKRAIRLKTTYQNEYRVITKDNLIKWVWGRGQALFDEDGVFQGIEGFVTDITARKLAEEELKTRNQVITSTSNGIIITDPNQTDNPIIYVNPAFEKMTGYSASEVIGKNGRFLHKNKPEQTALSELHKSLKAKAGCKVTIENVKKDGTTFWNELTISPVFDENGKLQYYVGIQNDISNQIAFRETEMTSQAILEALPDGIFLLDANGVYLKFFSENQIKSLGSPEEFIGKRIDEKFTEKQSKDLYQLLEKALNSEKVTIYEYPLNYNDEEIYYEFRALKFDIDKVIVISRDITERKKYEIALKNSEAKFRSYIEHSPMAIFITDAEGVYVEVNKAAGELLAIHPEDIIGKRFVDFIPNSEKMLEPEYLNDFISKHY